MTESQTTTSANYHRILCAECHKEVSDMGAMVQREDGVLICVECGQKYGPRLLSCDEVCARTLKNGVRYDEGKPRMDLLPGDALVEIAKVLTHGANKYSPRNWEKGMDWHKLYAPIQRHLWKWWQGEELDKESGLHHLAHAACDVLMLQATVLRGVGTDDRPRTNMPSGGTPIQS